MLRQSDIDEIVEAVYNELCDDPEIIEYYQNMEGGGLKDFVNKWYNRVKHVVFNTGSPNSDKMLEKYGDYKVDKIQVVREVVQKELTSILSVISFGKFSGYKEKYDDLFHLYAILQLIGPTGDIVYYRTEKEPTIMWKKQDGFKNIPADNMDNNGFPISFFIDLKNDPILKNVVKKTEESMGKSFSRYDAKTNNCQHYIAELVKSAMSLSMESASDIDMFQKYILQDVEEYLTGHTEKIAKSVTDLGHIFNRIRGNGRYLDRRVYDH